MDVAESSPMTENTTPKSSIYPVTIIRSISTAEQEDVDADANGVLLGSSFLERNQGLDGHDSDEISHPRRSRHTPIHQSDWRRYIVRFSVGLLLVVSVIYVVVDFCGDRKIESLLVAFLEWTHEHPYRGIVAVILCYIIATVLFVPGSILTFGAGFAIGSAVDNTVVGIILATASVFIGASIGSICSFLLGRYLFRECVLQLAFSYPLFQAIERALESNGLKIMILLRLSPLIPFNALDYISGISSISLRDYIIALVAILPGALVLCFLGASASSLSDRTSSTSSTTIKVISIVSGIIFGGGGVYLASHYSKIELDRILATQSANDLTEHIAGGLSREETNGIITETQRDDEDGGEIEEWGDELRENDGSNSKG